MYMYIDSTIYNASITKGFVLKAFAMQFPPKTRDFHTVLDKVEKQMIFRFRCSRDVINTFTKQLSPKIVCDKLAPASTGLGEVEKQNDI